MEYIVTAYTDIGIEKETNQDSVSIRRADIPGVGEALLVAVCDGMGGLNRGEVASAAAVNAFAVWFEEHLSALPSICGKDFSQIREQWTELIAEIHRAMLDYSEEQQVQIGTTVSVFFAYADRYLTLTIGDSRIYEYKKSLTQLTQDQSLVAREVANGRISEEESRHHPQRNILLQCVGTGRHITPAFTEGRVQNNTIYLLCTDGFVHEYSSVELEEKLRSLSFEAKEIMETALHDITEVCKARGETDNITAVLVKASESQNRDGKPAGLRRLRGLFKHKVVLEAEPSLLEKGQILHTTEVIGRD